MIHAVAGILLKNGKILLACRPIGKIHAGAWEFPGGKLEANETSAIALARELKEEIGITTDISQCELVTSIYQEYDHANVNLDVLRVINWQGIPISLEHQELYWHDLSEPCLKEPLLITTQKILDIVINKYGKKNNAAI